MKQAFTVTLFGKPPIRLAPGQSRPVIFHLALSKPSRSSLRFRLTYNKRWSSVYLHSRAVSHQFTFCDLREPHKLTFLHPSKVLSYAILRPPSRKASPLAADCKQAWPVVIALHGAGVEADSDQVRHVFDDAPDLRGWLLIPSGMTPWSGDDWRD